MKPRGIPFINLIHKSAISIQIHFVLSVSLFPLICLLKKISLCIIRDIFQFINYSELNENEQYHNLNCTHINLRSQSIINRYFLCGISPFHLPRLITFVSEKKCTKSQKRMRMVWQKKGWQYYVGSAHSFSSPSRQIHSLFSGSPPLCWWRNYFDTQKILHYIYNRHF